MNINVLITCLGLLVGISVHATTDKHFIIPKEQFREGVLIKNDKSCLAQEGKSLLSSIPKFPLESNTLYWRHKDNPREYNWFFGTTRIDCFGKLKAFNLKKNNLTAFEASYMRFYGTARAKSYQDEADLYFDSEYLYSQRVSTLYYMSNGKLKKLESEPLPGVLKVETTLSDYSFIVDGYNYGPAKKIFPLSPGLFYGTLVANGYLPYVEGALIVSGKETILKPTWVGIFKNHKKIPTSITEEKIKSTASLEEVEALYDVFIEELHQLPGEVFVDRFDSVYPKPKQFFFRLDDSEIYNKYLELFKIQREQAKVLWNESKLTVVKASYEALRSKLDSLEQLPLRIMLFPDSSRVFLNPVSAKPVDSINVQSVDSVALKLDTADSLQQEKNDSSISAKRPLKKEIELVFKGPKNRFDVIWRGPIPLVFGDSLVSFLNRRDPSLKVFLSLTENKPLWIQEEGLVKSRHHYRYIQIDFEYMDVTYPGSGAFILPPYIASNQEVQDWLLHKDMVVPPDSLFKDSIIPVKPVEKKVEPIVEPQDEEPELVKEDVNERLVKDSKKGDYIKIDSASFIFKEMVVYLSPYSINATEITQGHFARIMATLDSTEMIENHSSFKDPDKPVQNITWLDAKKFCEILGGSLPTEAQWEYAARTGGIQKNIWMTDKDPKPETYAIYKDNSYKKKKKDPLYGPQKVGSKKANKWGLYDVHGNVAEWVLDKYTILPYKKGKSNPKGPRFGSSKVIKGGSWKTKEKNLDLKAQDREDPRFWADDLGFRCAYPRQKGL
ncbi:MAG: formylglycine-generating enzyme family protein [Fibrobacter sp.]|nr:formylglycine-generating enzyme family protein [Fibrobacter sp.]